MTDDRKFINKSTVSNYLQRMFNEITAMVASMDLDLAMKNLVMDTTRPLSL